MEPTEIRWSCGVTLLSVYHSSDLRVTHAVTQPQSWEEKSRQEENQRGTAEVAGQEGVRDGSSEEGGGESAELGPRGGGNREGETFQTENRNKKIGAEKKTSGVADLPETGETDQEKRKIK